jgi:hypothetical protein
MNKIVNDVQVTWNCRECNRIYIQDSYPERCDCGYNHYRKGFNWIYIDKFELYKKQILKSISNSKGVKNVKE